LRTCAGPVREGVHLRHQSRDLPGIPVADPAGPRPRQQATEAGARVGDRAGDGALPGRRPRVRRGQLFPAGDEGRHPAGQGPADLRRVRGPPPEHRRTALLRGGARGPAHRAPAGGDVARPGRHADAHVRERPHHGSRRPDHRRGRRSRVHLEPPHRAREGGQGAARGRPLGAAHRSLDIRGLFGYPRRAPRGGPARTQRRATAGVREEPPTSRGGMPMTIAETFLPEFDQEMATTRRLLERVPSEKGTWKPHEKSFPLGHLAQLIARMPGWITQAMQSTGLDLGSFVPYTYEATETLLADFDRNVREARDALAAAKDADFAVAWSLTHGG